ncbi:MAG: LuxR C-terminal-related transcriptional regulator [Chryseolinea sp.]
MDTNIPMAVFQAESVLELASRLKDRDAFARAAYYLGKLYGMKMSNFKKGISYHEKSIKALGENDAVEYLADNHFSLATLYCCIGSYEKALNHLSTCLDIYQGKQDLLNEYFIRAFMANIYSEYLPHSFSKVREDFAELLEVSHKIKNDSLFVVTASYYTTALIAHGEFEAAELYANKALEIIKTNDHYATFKQLLYINLGDVFFHDGMLKAAINQYETAAEISTRFKINVGLFTSSLKLGKIYAVLNEDDLARKHYTDALRGFDYLGMTVKSIEVYGTLSLFEYKQQNFHEAFQYRSLQLALKDSLLYNQTESLVDLQSRMKIEKKVIKQKDEDINWLSINLILVVLLGGSFLGLLYLNKNRLLESKNRSMLVNEKIILEKELQNQRLHQEKLAQQLEFNAKALTINSLNMIEKNEILLQIKEKIATRRGSSAEDSQLINAKDLSQLVNFGLNIDKDWDNFKMHFEQVHNDFFDVLKSKYPHLNSSDLKLCALLKLNLDTKEIASIMNISAASVKVARSRLRKKLELDLTSNLSAFITQI